MKILWYFIVFLDFFFNIIKLGEPKFTISYSKSILIFSILEAACALHVQPMLVYIKSGNSTTVIWYCALNVFVLCKHCSGNSILVRHIFFFFSVSNSTVVTLFFVFHLYFFFSLLYILFYCTTNFTIFLQLLRCQFIII